MEGARLEAVGPAEAGLAGVAGLTERGAVVVAGDHLVCAQNHNKVFEPYALTSCASIHQTPRTPGRLECWQTAFCGPHCGACR